MTDQPTDQPTGVILKCQRCGGDMPPLPDDLAAMMQTAGGVILAHDVCPGDSDNLPKPEGRYFEVRVSIVEATEPHGEGDVVQIDELVSFRAGHRAPDLDSAMRPLALALGEKWTLAEKQAKVADS